MAVTIYPFAVVCLCLWVLCLVWGFVHVFFGLVRVFHFLTWGIPARKFGLSVIFMKLQKHQKQTEVLSYTSMYSLFCGGCATIQRDTRVSLKIWNDLWIDLLQPLVICQHTRKLQEQTNRKSQNNSWAGRANEGTTKIGLLFSRNK